MSASFSLAAANVTIVGDEGVEQTHSKVQVVCRAGRATLRPPRGGTPLATKEGVVTSEKVDRNLWRITFTDGEVWTVARTKPKCGTCG